MTSLVLLAILTNPSSGVEVYTSTCQTTSMAQDADGSLWVGTRGGVLHIDARNQVRRYTRLDGLPSHEIQSVSMGPNGVSVTTPLGGATWQEGRWQSASVGENRRLKLLSEPPEGLYVADTLAWKDRTYAAVFGSGLWVLDKTWKRFEPGVPAPFRDTTALAVGTRTAVGSNSNGVAILQEGKWKAVAVPDPPSMNVQAIQSVGDEMWVATLDQGLWALKAGAWKLVPMAKVPRQILPGADGVWVRHGTGVIESPGAKPPSDHLPRKQATSMDRWGGESFVSSWGGFSIEAGGKWEHHGNLPELKGLQTTAILGDSEAVYVGTQTAGLFRFDRDSGRLAHVDAGLKLGDDWVTCLAKDGKRVWIGTFVGGLTRLDEQGLRRIAGIEKENVTAICIVGERTFVGTRNRLFEVKGDRAVSAYDGVPLDTEVQALHFDGQSLWIGTRTSLWRVGTAVGTRH